jgi:hypothetical protein
MHNPRGTNNRHNENTRERANANLFVSIFHTVFQVQKYSFIEISIHRIMIVVGIMLVMMVPFFIMLNQYYQFNGPINIHVMMSILIAHLYFNILVVVHFEMAKEQR